MESIQRIVQVTFHIPGRPGAVLTRGDAAQYCVGHPPGQVRLGGRGTRQVEHHPRQHLPVEKEAIGPFTRKQAREARARLYAELFPLLEKEVAKALRIPGR